MEVFSALVNLSQEKSSIMQTRRHNHGQRPYDSSDAANPGAVQAIERSTAGENEDDDDEIPRSRTRARTQDSDYPTGRSRQRSWFDRVAAITGGRVLSGVVLPPVPAAVKQTAAPLRRVRL